MSAIRIKRGLDIPIAGGLTETAIENGPTATRIAVLAQEAVGIKPKMLVRSGDQVQIGTPLFYDKRDPEVLFTSPACGKVAEVNRGERRRLLSVSVDCQADSSQVELEIPGESDSQQLWRSKLAKTGWWPALRQRPFDSVARLGDEPQALLVTAMDTRPLAPSPLTVLAGRESAFQTGIKALKNLVDCPVWLCHKAGEDWSALTADDIQVQTFSGPHPAGNAGVHIHSLSPVGGDRKAWHVGYQEVADLGDFLATGKLATQKVIALVGPAAHNPRLLRVAKGADLAQITKDESNAEETRMISGCVLSGLHSEGSSPQAYLGARSNQVTLLDSQTHKKFVDWPNPLAGTHTVSNAVFSKFFRRKFAMNVDSNGSPRAIVPIGAWEPLMPMDILPTQLIKALASNDLMGSEKLGVLEVVEEDLALCEYADHSKTEISTLVRNMLTRIEKEG